MNTFQVDNRYATALFDLAGSKEERKRQLHDFDLLLEMLKKDPKIMYFFSSSQFTVDEKKSVIQKSLGKAFNPIIIQFLFFLLEKNRFDNLENIIKEYRKKVNEEWQVSEARLITSKPVGKAIVSKLKTKLENKYQKHISISEQIDPKLLGGGILLIDNKMLDFSIRDKLNKMKNDLLSVNV